MKLEKIFNRATFHRAFRKWATCQKQLKITELGSKCHDRNKTFEKKIKGAVIRKPMLQANFKVFEILKFCGTERTLRYYRQVDVINKAFVLILLYNKCFIGKLMS